MDTSIVIGWVRVMCSVIADHLSDRGDIVFTVSKSSSKRKNNIKCDILLDCTPIANCIESIDCLLYTPRYYGKT